MSLEDVEPDDLSLDGEVEYGGGGRMGTVGSAGGVGVLLAAGSLVSGVSSANIAGVGLKGEAMLKV